MPDEPTKEDESLASKAQICRVKTNSLKKGLARHKNLLSAKKKDLLSRQLQPPEDLTMFLQSDETFEEILKIANRDPKDIVVRSMRLHVHVFYSQCPFYDFTCRFLMCYLVYTNFQRQGAVANMTAGEVLSTDKCNNYRIVMVWDHKTVSTHGSARIAIHMSLPIAPEVCCQ